LENGQENQHTTGGENKEDDSQQQDDCAGFARLKTGKNAPSGLLRRCGDEMWIGAFQMEVVVAGVGKQRLVFTPRHFPEGDGNL